MRKLTKEETLAQIESSARIIYDAIEVGDSKTANKENKKLIKIFKYFETNLEFAKECIDEMYNSSNIVVISDAAAYSLALKLDIDRAIDTLNEISKNDNYGIYSFNAEMTLKVWNKDKELKIYVKK